MTEPQLHAQQRGSNTNILMLHLPEMRQLIDLSDLRLYLTSELLLTSSDQDKLRINPPHHTKDDVIYTLASLIQQKGNTGIKTFMSALKKSANSGNQPGHMELLRILEEDWKQPAADNEIRAPICYRFDEFEFPLSKGEAILCLLLVILGIIQFSIGIGGLGGAKVLECNITGGTIIQFFNFANGTILVALGLYPYLSRLYFSRSNSSESGIYTYPPSVRLLIIVFLVLEVGSFISTCIVVFTRSIRGLEGTCKPLTYYAAFLFVVVVTAIAAIASITSACRKLYLVLSNIHCTNT